jgi:Leucine-rich repeat (LRR) protein
MVVCQSVEAVVEVLKVLQSLHDAGAIRIHRVRDRISTPGYIADRPKAAKTNATNNSAKANEGGALNTREGLDISAERGRELGGWADVLIHFTINEGVVKEEESEDEDENGQLPTDWDNSKWHGADAEDATVGKEDEGAGGKGSEGEKAKTKVAKPPGKEGEGTTEWDGSGHMCEIQLAHRGMVACYKHVFEHGYLRKARGALEILAIASHGCFKYFLPPSDAPLGTSSAQHAGYVGKSQGAHKCLPVLTHGSTEEKLLKLSCGFLPELDLSADPRNHHWMKAKNVLRATAAMATAAMPIKTSAGDHFEQEEHDVVQQGANSRQHHQRRRESWLMPPSHIHDGTDKHAVHAQRALRRLCVLTECIKASHHSVAGAKKRQQSIGDDVKAAKMRARRNSDTVGTSAPKSKNIAETNTAIGATDSCTGLTKVNMAGLGLGMVTTLMKAAEQEAKDDVKEEAAAAKEAAAVARAAVHKHEEGKEEEEEAEEEEEEELALTPGGYCAACLALNELAAALSSCSSLANLNLGNNWNYAYTHTHAPSSSSAFSSACCLSALPRMISTITTAHGLSTRSLTSLDISGNQLNRLCGDRSRSGWRFEYDGGGKYKYGGLSHGMEAGDGHTYLHDGEGEGGIAPASAREQQRQGHGEMAGLSTLVTALFRHSPALSYLDASGNDLDAECARLISTALVQGCTHGQSNITTLKLGRNRLRGEGCFHLAEALARTREGPLKELDLSHNYINDEGVAHLARGLMGRLLLDDINHSDGDGGFDKGNGAGEYASAPVIDCEMATPLGIGHYRQHCTPAPGAATGSASLTSLDLSGNPLVHETNWLDCWHSEDETEGKRRTENAAAATAAVMRATGGRLRSVIRLSKAAEGETLRFGARECIVTRVWGRTGFTGLGTDSHAAGQYLRPEPDHELCVHATTGQLQANGRNSAAAFRLRMVALLFVDGIQALRRALKVNTELVHLNISGNGSPPAEKQALERTCKGGKIKLVQ